MFTFRSYSLNARRTPSNVYRIALASRTGSLSRSRHGCVSSPTRAIHTDPQNKWGNLSTTAFAGWSVGLHPSFQAIVIVGELSGVTNATRVASVTWKEEKSMTATNFTHNDLSDPIGDTNRRVQAYNDNVGEMLDGVFGDTVDTVEQRITDLIESLGGEVVGYEEVTYANDNEPVQLDLFAS